MGTLANISSAEAIQVFERLGWVFDRQRGSHVVLTKPGAKKTIVVPTRREIPKGTLRSLIRDAEITVDEFLTLL